MIIKLNEESVDKIYIKLFWVIILFTVTDVGTIHVIIIHTICYNICFIHTRQYFIRIINNLINKRLVTAAE